MSKRDEGGGLPQPEPGVERNPGNENEKTPQNNNASYDTPMFRAVEEHATVLGVSAPVFAAVKQAHGWAAGKKVEQTAFEQAVNGFLNAPMGGR